MLGNYFYYRTHATRDWSLCRMNIYTGEHELLRGNGITLDYSDPIPEYMVDQAVTLGGDIYYSTRVPNRLFRYNSDGDTLIMDYTDVDYFYFILHPYNDRLYFLRSNSDELNTGRLYEYNPLTNNVYSLELPDRIDPWRITVINGTLFYYAMSDLEELRYVQLSEMNRCRAGEE
jgi:hypothetical protein